MNMRIQTAAISDKGLSSIYSVNEDSYLVLEKERVFAVADGVGGAHAGEVASQSALSAIRQAVMKARPAETRSVGYVQKLINIGNDAVYVMGMKKQKLMASTIALMLICGDHAVLGHVGDSRIYVNRNGTLLQLTRDHSRLQESLDNAAETSQQEESPERHILTRALGAEPEAKPDIQKVILKHNDIFLLCTDGVYIHNSDADILNAIAPNRNHLPSICERLKAKCYQEGARDNFTAIVVRLATQDSEEKGRRSLKGP